MMYTRRKVLFNLINQLGNPSNVEIQKAMFLLVNNDYISEKLYDFFPNKRGCYSIRLKSDYHFLCDSGYLDEDYDKKTYKIANLDEYTKLIEFAINKEILEQIRKIATYVNTHTTEELIKYTYDLAPSYAVRSTLIDSLHMNNSTLSRIEEENLAIKNSEHAIYTIGYEGRSIDNFLNELIKRNISTLFDVRKNAYSMQFEFSAKPLKEALNEANIKYIHAPDVGIITEKRQELLPSGRQEELFAWYTDNILPHCGAFVNSAYSEFQNGNVAFMCYEKNPLDCHRSRIADFCLQRNSNFNKVIHI